MSTPAPTPAPAPTPSLRQEYAKWIVMIVTVAFAVIELLVAAGLVNLQNAALPANLQTQAHWYDNPVVWVLAITFIVNFAGFIENVVIENQSYDIQKFGETFFKYLPMMVIISQFIPNQEAAVFAFALDFISRALQNAGINATPAA
jgi:Na+/phosphate symporter